MTTRVLLFCCVAKLIVSLIRMVVGDSANVVYIGDTWDNMFALFNSSLNLMIYCYRIKDMRGHAGYNSVKNTES